jgi:hypothetical protein
MANSDFDAAVQKAMEQFDGGKNQIAKAAEQLADLHRARTLPDWAFKSTDQYAAEIGAIFEKLKPPVA